MTNEGISAALARVGWESHGASLPRDMEMIVIELPFPPNELSPNNHKVNWRERADRAASYRRDCGFCAASVRNKLPAGTLPLKAPVTAVITFILPNKRRRDYLNLYAAFKAGEDALVDARLIEDDNVWKYHPELRVEQGPLGVRVELEPA